MTNSKWVVRVVISDSQRFEDALNSCYNFLLNLWLKEHGSGEEEHEQGCNIPEGIK